MPFVLRNIEDEVDFICNCPGKTSVGRGEHNNWTPPNSRAISKEHSIIEIYTTNNKTNEFTTTITDLDSRNGTFIGNGNPIEWHRIKGSNPIKIGDKIRFGTGGPAYLFLNIKIDDALNIIQPKNLPEAARENINPKENLPKLLEAQNENMEENDVENFNDELESQYSQPENGILNILYASF